MKDVVAAKLQDREFVQKLAKMDTEEQVIKAFADEGIAFDKHDLEELQDVVSDVISKLKKLPEDELQNVAGGMRTYVTTVYERSDYEVFNKFPELVIAFGAIITAIGVIGTVFKYKNR